MLTFNRYKGGWGYDSECSRFAIINLSKVDSDENGPNKGWRLIDRKTDDWAGDYKTLTTAKKAAEEIARAN